MWVGGGGLLQRHGYHNATQICRLSKQQSSSQLQPTGFFLVFTVLSHVSHRQMKVDDECADHSIRGATSQRWKLCLSLY